MQKLVFINGNGTQIDLTAGNFGVVNWAGLSNTSLNIQTQQVPFEDGGVFLDALMEQREIELTIAIYDGNNLSLRYQKKRELISALNPKLGEGVLIYTNDYLSKQIKAIPQIPLFENKNSNDVGTLKASITFTCCSPYWEDVDETEVEFGVGEILTIKNEGDIPAQMEIEFLTGNARNPEIVNISTDKKISYSGTLNSNLYINTNYGQKKVYTEDMDFIIDDYRGNFKQVIYSNKLHSFIAIQNNLVRLSYDGVEWISYVVQNARELNSITYSETLDLYVVVGTYGKLFTSSNLKDWNEINLNTTNTLSSVDCSENMIVVVGYSGSSFYSSDGVNWTSVHLTFRDMYKVFYVEDLELFVAGGYYGSLLVSSDGINWIGNSINGNNSHVSIKGFAYSENLGLFAIRENGKIIKKTGEQTWSEIGHYTYLDNDIIYSEELKLFVMVGDKVIRISEDCETWTSIGGKDQKLNSIVYSIENNNLMVVGEANCVYLNSNNADINSWISQTINGVYGYNGMTYSEKNKMYLAVGGRSATAPDVAGTGYVSISYDKKNWRLIEIRPLDYEVASESCILDDVCYSETQGIFVAIAYSYIFKSSDGVNWTRQYMSDGYSLCGRIIFSKKLNKFVVLAGGGVYTSTDAETWTYTHIETGTPLDLKYFEEIGIFAVIINQSLYTSPDGENWTEYPIGQNSGCDSITYSVILKLFVMVGTYQKIFISKDLLHFTIIDVTFTLQKITYSKELNLFIGVGSGGMIVISPDGTNWTELKKNVNVNYRNIYCFDNLNKIFIIGPQSTLLENNFTEAENKIQNITADSDMGFNLKIGNNQIRIVRYSGELNCRIKYRQKYIGV